MPTGALIMDLSVSPSNWSLRAATHGLGVWERTLVSATAAEGDTVAPSFLFAPVRNSVLRPYLDLYFVPSEILPTLPEADVDGSALSLGTITTVDGNLYVADWELDEAGTYTITIDATDFAGNDSTSTFTFAAALVSAGQGCALNLSGAGVTLADAALTIEPGAVAGQEYVVAAPISEGVLGLLPVGGDRVRTAERYAGAGTAGAGTAATVAAGSGDRTLGLWSFQPADLHLASQARLVASWDRDALAGADPAALSICRRESGGWIPLPSYVDPERRTVEAAIDRLGVYSLRLGDGTAAGPVSFGLEQNFPNPFNGATTLRYALPQAGPVELAVLNVRGQRVRTLVSGGQEAGRHTVSWDGRSDAGREVATGIYLIMLRAGGRTFTIKALYIR